MKKLTLSLCVCSIIFCVVGCSVKVEEKILEKDRYVESSTGEPIALKFQTESCQEVLSEQSFPVIYPATAGEIIEYRPNATDILNRFYTEILLGGKIQRIREFFVIEDNTYLRSTDKVLENPRSLVLCSDMNYDFDSYESAAIHASHILDLAHKKLVNNKSMSRLDLLSPVSLKVAPLIETITQYENSKEVITKKKFLVNNAYYNATTKEIVFLPQGKNPQGHIPFNGVPLWHIPITASHEYGHHVFSHLMPNYFNELAHHAHILCFDNRENVSLKDIPKNKMDMLGKRESHNIDAVLRAINEGFADLIANYSLPKKYTSLDIVPCLNDSREIDVAVFANGEEKNLNDHALDAFLSGSKEALGSCLEEVDYKDPHILGALVAHSFDSIFTTFEMDSNLRLQTLMNWVAALNDNYPTMQQDHPADFFHKAMELFLDQLHDIKSDQTKVEMMCKLLDNKAPLLKPYFECPEDNL